MCCVINVDFLAWVVKKAVAAKRTGEEYLERAVNLNLVMELVRGCSQMTSAFFGVSDTLWCLCQHIISFWHAPWCFKFTMSALNQKQSALDDHWKCPINHQFAPKGVQLSLVRPTRAFFGWIPSNRWIFQHSSSFLMTLGPSSSAFVSFLSYHWLFNVATSFVNGP